MNQKAIVACVKSNEDRYITVIGRKMLEAAKKIEAPQPTQK